MFGRNKEGGLAAEMAGGVVIVVACVLALVVCFSGDGGEVDGFLRPRPLDALFERKCLKCFEGIVVKA